MPRQVETAGLLVEMRDPQALAIGALFGKAAGKEAARRGEAVEL
jgi:hypothetical protein